MRDGSIWCHSVPAFPGWIPIMELASKPKNSLYRILHLRSEIQNDNIFFKTSAKIYAENTNIQELQSNLFLHHQFAQVDQTITHTAKCSINAAIGH